MAVFLSWKCLAGDNPGKLPRPSSETENQIRPELTMEELIHEIFQLLYQERGEKQSLGKEESRQLEKLKNDLWVFEKRADFKEDKNTILFLRGEANYRQGNIQRAYVIFSRLKFRLADKSHPLYPEAEKRLKSLSKKIKPVNKPVERQAQKKDFIIPGLFIAMGLLTLIFLDYEKFKGRIYDSRILGEDRLITLEDMREQDGRCSATAMEEYCRHIAVAAVTWNRMPPDLKAEIKARHWSEKAEKIYHGLWERTKEGWETLDRSQKDIFLKDKYTGEELADYSNMVWETLNENQKEKYKYARLIFEGHQMIKEVNYKPPFPIAFISGVPVLNKISHYWQYTLTGGLFILVWWGVGQGLGTRLCTEKTWQEFALLAAFVIACLSGIKIMSGKTINALDEMVSMLEPDNVRESLHLLKKWIIDLFRSPRQYYFSILVMAMVIWCLYEKDELIIKETGLHNLDILFSLVLVWMSSSLIWFLTGSLFLMHKLYNLKDLSMNPLSPSKTMGLEKMISVIGTYNVITSLVCSLGCSIAVYQAIKSGYSLAYGSLWFFFITPILVFYWIYPYMKIGSLVKAKKINRMNFVKTKIALLFDDWKILEDNRLETIEKKQSQEDSLQEVESGVSQEKKKIENKIKDMDQYYEIFKKIEESPESYFDFNSALELAKAMGFPSLFAILSALISLYA